MSRRVLAVDCDDVIAGTTEAVWSHMRATISPEIPRGNISCPRYWKNRTGLNVDAAKGFFRTFESDGYPGIMPMPHVHEGLAQLSRLVDAVHVVTSRVRGLRKITEDFIYVNGLDGLIEDIHHADNPFRSVTEKSKHEICRDIGATVLIDDSPEQIVGMVRNGLNGVLFGTNPWQIMPRDIEPSARMSCWSDTSPAAEVLYL